MEVKFSLYSNRHVFVMFFFSEKTSLDISNQGTIHMKFEDILLSYFLLKKYNKNDDNTFSEKISLDMPIHVKCKDLFLPEKKKVRVSSAINFTWRFNS